MKQTLTIENPPLDFGDTTFLSIVTQEPEYLLADSLNRLYDLSLAREADLRPFGYPYYVSTDISHSPLVYRLVSLAGTDRGFLLIVSGSERARGEALRICDEFCAPIAEPNPYELPDVEREEILNRYRRSLTMVSEIKFTEEELEQASSSKRRALKGRVALADLYARIMDAIDLAS